MDYSHQVIVQKIGDTGCKVLYASIAKNYHREVFLTVDRHLWRGARQFVIDADDKDDIWGIKIGRGPTNCHGRPRRPKKKTLLATQCVFEAVKKLNSWLKRRMENGYEVVHVEGDFDGSFAKAPEWICGARSYNAARVIS